jgi:hypothetical protein
VENLRFNLATVGVAAVLVGVPLWYLNHDPKLAPDETAAALRAKLGTPYGFRCTPEDGTFNINLEDVDYVCQAERSSEPGYWVGTDGSRITGIQSMG